MLRFILTVEGDELLGVYAKNFHDAGIAVIDAIGNPWVLVHTGRKVSLNLVV